jgi:PBP1b-binding outer membrane lipoprotein LpoB
VRVLPSVFLAVFLFSGCSKTPESETAKKIGEQPKQIVDKVGADVNKAMQKEAQRQQPDPEKKD